MRLHGQLHRPVSWCASTQGEDTLSAGTPPPRPLDCRQDPGTCQCATDRQPAAPRGDSRFVTGLLAPQADFVAFSQPLHSYLIRRLPATNQTAALPFDRRRVSHGWQSPMRQFIGLDRLCRQRAWCSTTGAGRSAGSRSSLGRCFGVWPGRRDAEYRRGCGETLAEHMNLAPRAAHLEHRATGQRTAGDARSQVLDLLGRFSDDDFQRELAG